jgi:ribosome-binding protein aMBF1 (putative translation factor)
MGPNPRRKRRRPDLPPMGLAKQVGQRVRAARIAKGMSQAQLGAPMTRAMVSAVELGRISPSLDGNGRIYCLRDHAYGHRPAGPVVRVRSGPACDV